MNKIKNLWENLKGLKTKFRFLKLFKIALILIGMFSSYQYANTKINEFTEWLIMPNNHFVATIKIPKAEAVEPEPTMREWIKKEVEIAGLSWEEVDCLIQNESGWKQWNNNWNTNGTVDSGIFMINSIHKNTISLQDRYDYKTATKWAINKRLENGNWDIWYGFKKCK